MGRRSRRRRVHQRWWEKDVGGMPVGVALILVATIIAIVGGAALLR
ncbi:hypothetical protein [Microbacterium hominis]|uniref:Uncharacterized protein n=1 Tax=Microbacterium hominis TaxID=162426 RepID=A0A7D4PW46_9MICO|nr:hypothetical protein [Microbacterium hominis]QKJ20274.1 hypothetical protein HQM25_13510 [Microbacterium hominis]